MQRLEPTLTIPGAIVHPPHSLLLRMPQRLRWASVRFTVKWQRDGLDPLQAVLVKHVGLVSPVAHLDHTAEEMASSVDEGLSFGKRGGVCRPHTIFGNH